MKYLKTKHEKNSAKITTLILLILVLLIFIVGPQYIDPPEEYGVDVNFGTNNTGKGNRPLSKPIQADIPIQAEPQMVEKNPAENNKTLEKSEKVLTQDSEEAIAIKKKKTAEAKAKAEAERAERIKREAEEIKKREDAEKKKKLDNLIGGVKNSKGNDYGGKGDDNKPGNKGQLNGDPYATSIFGDSGPGKDGVDFGLGGRDKVYSNKFEQDCNEEGLVVVEIRVNRNGKVVKATPGIQGTNGTSCLFEAAKKTALSFKFTPNQNAPDIQIGYVSVNFALGQ
ncbi:energy transducer TonB [uncultured Winogradskyella sp.]|jgi:membrane protein involved in colicin uptake|uniref:energy transducer TonB n=1 Tax=uncultured Winogradskyella sp. TaxID=395353 RepID=UPI0023030FA9|nr:energy transducer TonB [Winogradskyella sp.]MDA8874286.1 energy transducer TonB [Winogradskyella sp.]